MPEEKLKKEDIFTAPPVPEAVPPTAGKLRELIEERGPSAPLYFSLGNVLLRSGSAEDSVDAYRNALLSDVLQPELHTNLGVALVLIGKYEEALSSFRQAILINPSLALPHLHSGRVQLQLRQFDAAETSFEKVLKLEPGWAEPYLRLAELAELRGDHDASVTRYQQALQVNPELGSARSRLALSEFEKGKTLLAAEEYEQAFALWARAERQFAPAFSVEQPIVTELQRLSRDYERSGDLAALRNEYLRRWPDERERRDFTHQFVARFLFSLGLVPECYEERETLDDELDRWHASLRELGEHPYPHFRIALIHAYSGRLAEAESEIRHCQDKLLPKKQTALKLAGILEFVKEMQDLEKQAREGMKSHSPDFEWEEEGFENVFERNSWKQANFTPAEAKAWKAAGFSAVKAKGWRKEDISPSTASKWAPTGEIEPRAAKRWIRAGMGVDEALRWVPYFGENVEQAIQCRSVGFEDPKLASEWLKIVLFPWDAIRWHEVGFSPKDAEQFIALGIRDPHQAKEHLRNNSNSEETKRPETDE